MISSSITLSELLTLLLSASPDLRIDALELDTAVPALTLMVTPIQSRARCPICSQVATRVHSRYGRTLADLPWAQLAVHLQLHVRKFFCDTTGCPRRIFTERLPRVVAPWGRRTVRLTDQQRHMGLALGGSAAARLGNQLQRPASRTTFLHVIRTTPEEERPTPRVLGVDDWSQLKGQTYRTILVDIERHRPIELLPDREAATLATWLAAHPGVEIMGLFA